MNKNSKNANFKSQLEAMKLAEIKATDKEDLIACASDMQKTASLNKDEAIIVANAIRSKYLPNVVRQAGLEVSNLDLEDGKETVDFTNDLSEEDDDDLALNMGAEDDEDDDEDMDDMDNMDDMDDDVNVDENSDDVAVFEIEVPAQMVDAAQKAVQEALDNLLSGDDDSDDDDDEDITHFDDDDDSEDESDDENLENTKISKKVNDMNRTTLAERKALREALVRKAEREEMLMKLASDEETVQTSAGFQHNESMANMPGSVDYPTMSLENDGGNSLKEQNPTWNESRIPTNNPGSLQFPDVTKPMKLEGTSELEVTVDWESLTNPSQGLEDKNLFKVPTQMPGMPHKTTVAAKSEVECTACGTRMSMTDDEMNNEATRCANKECPTNASDEGHADGERSAESTTELVNDAADLSSGINSAKADLNNAKGKANDAANTFNSSIASLDTARLKTAYSCSTKLALAGIITTEEVDSYAEQMLNDGLKADSMIRQTKLLLKSAQSSSERIAAAAAERSTRTASNTGISTTPAFSGGHTANGAALDIQSALKGAFTMPKIED
jgi:hypothetical protein